MESRRSMPIGAAAPRRAGRGWPSCCAATYWPRGTSSCRGAPAVQSRCCRGGDGSSACGPGGGGLAIVNVYLQSGDAKAQASALAGPVQARAARDGDSVILAGDFNFTEHAQLDRAGWDRQRPEDSAPARLMATMRRAAGLHDVFRARHPTTRSFTHTSHHSAARLDRLYAAGALLARVISCRPALVLRQDGGSDHHPVVLHLGAGAPPVCPWPGGARHAHGFLDEPRAAAVVPGVAGGGGVCSADPARGGGRPCSWAGGRASRAASSRRLVDWTASVRSPGRRTTWP